MLGRQLLERLGLVRGAPDVGVGRVRLLGRVAVRQAALDEELAHLRAAAELVDELRVEPRLVDAQVRVDQQAVAVEALDVVALVGRAVAPDVDAVVAHRPHEQRAGDRAPERRGVEVRACRRCGCGTRRTAARSGPRGRARRGSRPAGPARRRTAWRGRARRVEVGLVVLAEVGGVGVRDRALLAHPRDGGRRVEAAGERDARRARRPAATSGHASTSDAEPTELPTRRVGSLLVGRSARGGIGRRR